MFDILLFSLKKAQIRDKSKKTRSLNPIFLKNFAFVRNNTAEIVNIQQIGTIIRLKKKKQLKYSQ